MNGKFADFIEPARNRSGPWWVLLAVVLIGTFYFVLSAGVLFIWGLLEGIGYAPSGIIEDLLTSRSTQMSVVVLMTTFFAMFAAVWIVVRFIHRRGLTTLFGPGPVLRNFLIAVAILVPISTASFFVLYGTDDIEQVMPVSVWLGWFAIAVPLLLVQVTAEELIFRGYLQQQLAVWSSSRWVWMVVPSILFGLAHIDRATMGENTWLVVGFTCFFGLIMAEITARTGNLGAAIGLHFVNNIGALLIISLQGHLAGLSLYQTTFSASDSEIVRLFIYKDLAFSVILFAVFLFVTRKPKLG